MASAGDEIRGEPVDHFTREIDGFSADMIDNTGTIAGWVRSDRPLKVKS